MKRGNSKQRISNKKLINTLVFIQWQKLFTLHTVPVISQELF
jgi:hypothetical protein